MNKDYITKLTNDDLIDELINEAKTEQYHNCFANWHDSGVEDNLRQAAKAHERIFELRKELSRRLDR